MDVAGESIPSSHFKDAMGSRTLRFSSPKSTQHTPRLSCCQQLMPWLAFSSDLTPHRLASFPPGLLGTNWNQKTSTCDALTDNRAHIPPCGTSPACDTRLASWDIVASAARVTRGAPAWQQLSRCFGCYIEQTSLTEIFQANATTSSSEELCFWASACANLRWDAKTSSSKRQREYVTSEGGPLASYGFLEWPQSNLAQLLKWPCHRASRFHRSTAKELPAQDVYH